MTEVSFYLRSIELILSLVGRHVGLTQMPTESRMPLFRAGLRTALLFLGVRVALTPATSFPLSGIFGLEASSSEHGLYNTFLSCSVLSHLFLSCRSRGASSGRLPGSVIVASLDCWHSDSGQLKKGRRCASWPPGLSSSSAASSSCDVCRMFPKLKHESSKLLCGTSWPLSNL